MSMWPGGIVSLQRAEAQAVMLLHTVAAALRRSMPEPVLARIGQKRTVLMSLTTAYSNTMMSM